jgi:hypothetical protein
VFEAEEVSLPMIGISYLLIYFAVTTQTVFLIVYGLEHVTSFLSMRLPL